MGKFLSFTCLLTLTLYYIVGAQRPGQGTRNQEARTILNNLLSDSGYDSHVCPRDNGTEVRVNYYVRNMDIVDKVRGELHLQLTLRQTWNDPRLVFSRTNPGITYLILHEVDRAWKPDLFIANELEANLHDFSMANSFIRIYPNGDVIMSQRVSMKLSCPMEYRNYPFDTQDCRMRFASYAQTTDYIIFDWDDNPVSISADIPAYTKHFKLQSYNTSKCDSRTRTGVYSCVETIFEFRRSASFYFVHMFIPCTMLVIISWLVFWLEPLNVVVRLILTLSTLFVLVIQVSAFNKDIPAVEYTKAIDKWTGSCLTFVFITLLESVVVNYIARQEEKRRNQPSRSAAADADPETEGLKGPETSEKADSAAKKYIERYWTRFSETSQKIDGAMRIVYPTSFIIFALVFFAVYAS